MCVPCRAVPVASRVPNVWCVLGELVQAGRWASGELLPFRCNAHVTLDSVLGTVGRASLVCAPEMFFWFGSPHPPLES